jgi:UDP-glucuronate decarboxylase
VDDLIDGMIKMMRSPDVLTGPVNLGNSNEFTMLDLAQKVIELTKSKSNLVFKPLPQDDPKQRQPDITLAKKELDWKPSVELEAGLMKTVAYFKGLI